MKMTVSHFGMAGRVLFSAALVAGFSVGVPACQSAEPQEASPTGEASGAAPLPNQAPPGAASAADAGGEVEPPPPPCDEAKMAAIQKSFDDEAIPLDVGAVAVVKDRSCGSRYFTRGASKDVPETALHLIGSATKSYIASLTLLLVEEGKLSLTDPIDKWLPGVPAGDKITVEHLLHHTSGLYNYSNNWLYVVSSWLKTAFRPSDLLNYSFSNPMSFSPGAENRWEYSNTNYVLLGVLIEAVTGKPVAQVLRNRILDKIGAKSTFFYGYEPIEGSFAPAVTFLGSPGLGFMHPSATWSCGNMVATIDDLVEWTEKRGNGSFHSPAMQAELMKGVYTGLDFTYGAALVMVGEGVGPLKGNGPAIGHGGDIPGYHTVSYYFPNKKATISMVMHSDRGPGTNSFFAVTYAESLYQTLVDPYFGTMPTPKAQ